MKTDRVSNPKLDLALASLDGLSVGDAFGETFFSPAGAIVKRFAERRPAPPPWFWTDDTAMAIGIVETLAKCGSIDQDELAATFARNHSRDPMRGYGAGARQILRQIEIGMRWQAASKGAFSGSGSLGNGAAMLDVAIDLTPGSQVRVGIERARNLGPDISVPTAVNALGNGMSITAPDTVPFALWNASRRIDDFEDALWETATGMGDVDTTCAIVGGIVGAAVGRAGIPAEWLAARESLPPIT
ncbi:MAG: ADP-ribosylglycohydrolase family protein [Planctomycetota bacterium]